MDDREWLRLSVEATTPNNTVIYDDRGNPSIMVRIPKFSIGDVIEGGSAQTHPAFIVKGREVDEIYLSKYSNTIIDGRACSLPAVCPDSEVIFELAKEACEKKGPGWHMMSHAEWAAVALWCNKNGYFPRGNNNFGKDISHPHEQGVVVHRYERNGAMINGKTATGSGPVAWSHDKSPSGIFDMNGNVWTALSGFRLVDGQIQVIPDNNSASACDEGPDSKEWKAILEDGSLVDPCSDRTIYLRHEGERLIFTLQAPEPADVWQSSLFGSIDSDFEVPERLKVLGLYPVEGPGYGEQKVWISNTGIRMPWRGGTWDAFANSGVFCLFACYPSDHVSMWMGFRSAYVEC